MFYQQLFFYVCDYIGLGIGLVGFGRAVFVKFRFRLSARHKGPTPEARRADRAGEGLLWGLGERCKLPQRGSPGKF